MKKNFFFLLLISILLIGCSSGGGDSSSSSGGGDDAKPAETTLDIAYAAQPPTLDPHMTVAVATSEIGRNIYESLLALDENNEPAPLLAESFEPSEDLKTLTFKLRQGVKFHNGKEMTADDVVASMERWRKLNGKANTYFANSEFVKVDDYTVELRMDQPFTIAKYILSANYNFAAIMPKEIIDEAPESGVTEHIGTGPYKLAEWKQDQYIKLEKFEDYQQNGDEPNGFVGKKAALMEEVYFHMVPDSATRTAGVQSGEYDVAALIPHDSFSVVDSDPNLETFKYAEGFTTVVFNKRNGLFSDQKARKALNLAVNKNEVLIAALTDENFFTPEHGLLPKDFVGWYNDAGKDVYDAYNPEEAKKLFEEAGYNGETLKILTTRDYNDQYQVAVVIQENLKQIGVESEIMVYDWATLMEVREDDEFYDLMPMSYNPVTDPTQINFLDSRINYTGWTNSPEIDSLLDQLMVAPSDEEAKKIFTKLQAEFWDYLPAVKFGDLDAVSATRNNVKDVEFFHGPVIWNAYIE